MIVPIRVVAHGVGAPDDHAPSCAVEGYGRARAVVLEGAEEFALGAPVPSRIRLELPGDRDFFGGVGRVSHLDRINESTNSLSSAWEKEVGTKSAWVVSLACFLTPLGAALTYSIMLGDLLSSLACSAGLTGLAASRQASILGISASILYPLCNLKSLAALSVVSMVG